METIRCNIHGMMKQYLMCLNRECKQKLLCWKCHQNEKQHENSLMDEVMIENRNEIENMLNEAMNGIKGTTNND